MLEITSIGLILGGLVTLFFIGFLFLMFTNGPQSGDTGILYREEVKLKNLTRPRLFVASCTLIMGILNLFSWMAFLTHTQKGFFNSILEHLTPFIFGLFSSVLLWRAGMNLLRGHPRGPRLLMWAVAVLTIGTALILSTNALQDAPLLVQVRAITIICVFVYFISLVYGWEHFVLHLDEEDQKK